MKSTAALTLAFILLETLTAAQSWDEAQLLYVRDALADAEAAPEAYDAAEELLWARDAEAEELLWARDAEAEPEADAEAEYDFEELILARDADADADADFDFEEFLYTREAKKQQDPWVQPQVNIPPGDKITKDTFKCNQKKHKCSGQIQVSQ